MQRHADFGATRKTSVQSEGPVSVSRFAFMQTLRIVVTLCAMLQLQGRATPTCSFSLGPFADVCDMGPNLPHPVPPCKICHVPCLPRRSCVFGAELPFFNGGPTKLSERIPGAPSRDVAAI